MAADEAKVRRSPTIAVLFSSIFPGLGQLYNRELRKAGLFAVGAILTAFGPLSPLDMDIDLADPSAGLRNVLLASLPFLVIAVWSVVDAYRVAKRT
jgi:uncharacterized protein DUF5683